MVRLLYISGMVFFTVLIGDSAHRLHVLYEGGSFFDPYNSERKSAVTLLAVSSCGLGGLCVIEMIRLKRRLAQQSLMPILKGEESAEEDPLNSTCIYAAPATVDEWEERIPRIIVKKGSRRSSFFAMEMSGLWMSLLRIYCGVLPIVYFYILVDYLFLWIPSGAGSAVLTILFPLLFLGSVATSVGILRHRAWGIKTGYAVAVFHLLIFPVGTAVGFIMLMSLMGVTGEFKGSRKHRRRANRKARKRKLQSAHV